VALTLSLPLFTADQMIEFRAEQTGKGKEYATILPYPREVLVGCPYPFHYSALESVGG